MNGLEIIHGLPIVITDSTKITIDGETIDFNSFDDYADDIYSSDVECDFLFQYGWLEAQKLSVTNYGESPSDDTAIFNYRLYDDYFGATENAKPYLQIKENETVNTDAHLVSITEVNGEIPYCTIQYYDIMNGVPVIHSLNVYYEDNAPEFAEQTNELSNFNIKLENGKLNLVSQ